MADGGKGRNGKAPECLGKGGEFGLNWTVRLHVPSQSAGEGPEG